jgi:hypothetical protein
MLGTLLVVLLLVPQTPPQDRPLDVPRPKTWIAFSADIQYGPPQEEARGRYVQDEHGCQRVEFHRPDGTSTISILNVPEQKNYTLRDGLWKWQQTRLLDYLPGAPVALEQRLEALEGLAAYRRVHTINSANGRYDVDDVIIPALNDFVARRVSRQDNNVAHNIKIGVQDHKEFSPADGAYLIADETRSHWVSYARLTLRIAFPNAAPIDLQALEDQGVRIQTPGGSAMQLLARRRVDQPDRLHVTLQAFLTGAGPRDVRTVVLEEFEFGLTETGTTRTLAENFSITVLSVGGKQLR